MKYYSHCRTHQINEVLQSLSGGAVRSHDILDTRWDAISVNFLPDLPEDDNGHDAVPVVVDRLLSCGEAFIPLSRSANATIVAHLLQSYVSCKH